MIKLEFIQKLQKIVLHSPKNEEQMKILEAECIEIMKQIGYLGLANSCPDIVWHYLTDVDIRYKDAEYAKYQTALLMIALEEWAKVEDT